MVFVPTAKGISTQSLGVGKMIYQGATVSEPETVDPAKLADEFDSSGAELIRNVYDPLIFFKGSDMYNFVPWLATSWTISPDGTMYNFGIRENVTWQDASYGFVTPADVEYSLKKILVRDYTDSSAGYFWFAIFGITSATDYGDLADPAVATALGNLIDNAITSGLTTVSIQFATGVPYPNFLVLLARASGAIQCKQWAIDHGDWNPAVDKLSDGTWVNAHNPATSPLDAPSTPWTTGFMMGSGPYRFGNLTRSNQTGGPPGFASMFRFNNFWGGWGTNRAWPLGLIVTPRGYLDQIFEVYTSNYATRLAGFIGTSPYFDSIYVEGYHRADVWQQPGVKCRYPLEPYTYTQRYWARDWVHGWYYNPIFFPGSYFYTMWKEDMITSTQPEFAGKHANWEDVNEDGKVNIKDLALGAKAFGAYYIDPDLPPFPAGPPGDHSSNWDSKADVNVVNIVTGARQDMKVDIKDLATIGKLFGFLADPWTPGP